MICFDLHSKFKRVCVCLKNRSRRKDWRILHVIKPKYLWRFGAVVTNKTMQRCPKIFVVEDFNPVVSIQPLRGGARCLRAGDKHLKIRI